jgi:L-iditol 2-dehydrogenase
MKAVVAMAAGELAMIDLEVPQPSDYEALVRMEACAICNSTDHKLLTGDFVPGPFPVVLGHEVVGRVVEAGPKVINYRSGDRVFRQRLRDEHVPGDGRSCWGGFAEYGLVTDEWAIRGIPYGPEQLPHDQQKLLLDVEPSLATAMITLMETLDCVLTCGASEGKSVAVVGSGPVGQCFALFSRLLGAGPVFAFGRTSRNASRFGGICRSDGFIIEKDYPKEVRRIVETGGFDIVIEAVGSQSALTTCLELAGSTGNVYVYGIAPEAHPFQDNQMRHPRVHQVGAVEGRVQARLLKFIEGGAVHLEDWVSHCTPLSEYQRGFDLVIRKQALKLVLIPSS